MSAVTTREEFKADCWPLDCPSLITSDDGKRHSIYRVYAIAGKERGTVLVSCPVDTFQAQPIHDFLEREYGAPTEIVDWEIVYDGALGRNVEREAVTSRG